MLASRVDSPPMGWQEQINSGFDKLVAFAADADVNSNKTGPRKNSNKPFSTRTINCDDRFMNDDGRGRFIGDLHAPKSGVGIFDSDSFTSNSSNDDIVRPPTPKSPQAIFTTSSSADVPYPNTLSANSSTVTSPSVSPYDQHFKKKFHHHNNIQQNHQKQLQNHGSNHQARHNSQSSFQQNIYKTQSGPLNNNYDQQQQHNYQQSKGNIINHHPNNVPKPIVHPQNQIRSQKNSSNNLNDFQPNYNNRLPPQRENPVHNQPPTVIKAERVSPLPLEFDDPRLQNQPPPVNPHNQTSANYHYNNNHNYQQHAKFRPKGKDWHWNNNSSSKIGRAPNNHSSRHVDPYQPSPPPPPIHHYHQQPAYHDHHNPVPPPPPNHAAVNHRYYQQHAQYPPPRHNQDRRTHGPPPAAGGYYNHG